MEKSEKTNHTETLEKTEEKKEIRFNPFHDAGITNYEQFKLYPFLVFSTLETIKNRITQQIKQIKDGHFFGDRVILLGERGIGKTSTLFFIKDMLNKENIRAEIFSRLIEDENHLKVILSTTSEGEVIDEGGGKYFPMKGESFEEITNKPIYLLIDFPDIVEIKNFKRFLEFLWSLMIHKNYNKINLIFAMNKSHYDKSFAFSETLGKFLTLRLEKLDKVATRNLISSRLEKIESKIEDFFDEDVFKIIFSYSKGIPRNIISACSLLIDNLNSNIITKESAESILKEKYFDQVINDRVEDPTLKKIYNQMIKILEEEFNGNAPTQERYVEKVMVGCKVGRNTVLARIKDLIKFGIFNQYRGGPRRASKILSFS